MSRKSSSLKKIEHLYGLIETMHAAELQHAAALMHEAEAAILAQRVVMREARRDAQIALGIGDREDYAVAEIQREVGGRRQQRLEEIRQVRSMATEAAREEYGASRIKRGQIKTVVDSSAAEERYMADRRAQIVSDDRFLSRLRWNQLQE